MNRTIRIGTTTGLLLLAAGAVFGAERERERGDRERRRSAEPAVKPSASAAPSAVTPAAPAGSLEAFQIIQERNIFNPNRVGRTRAAPEEKPPRVDEFALVGTMQYEKGLLAFFESPDSALKKAAREGETVGEFTVKRISADSVELVRGDQTIPLRVAQQMRRPEGGEWKPGAAPVDTSTSTLRTSRPDSAAPVEIPADASEVLKRLMKQREKQLK